MNTIGCVSIPSFAATAWDSGTTFFTVPGLPTDGSIGLAFITIDPSLGVWQDAGPIVVTQRLAVYIGGAEGVGCTSRTFQYGVLGGRTGYLPDGWTFI